jgi:hypothetical protein
VSDLYYSQNDPEVWLEGYVPYCGYYSQNNKRIVKLASTLSFFLVTRGYGLYSGNQHSRLGEAFVALKPAADSRARQAGRCPVVSQTWP